MRDDTQKTNEQSVELVEAKKKPSNFTGTSSHGRHMTQTAEMSGAQTVAETKSFMLLSLLKGQTHSFRLNGRAMHYCTQDYEDVLGKLMEKFA